MFKTKTHNAYIIMMINKESYIKTISHNGSIKNHHDSYDYDKLHFLFIYVILNKTILKYQEYDSVKFEYTEYHKSVSNEELIADLKTTAKKLNMSSLSMKEYDENGQFSSSAVARRFGTWNKALEMANLEYRNRFFSNTELFENIEKVWIKIGKQPTKRDMDNALISSISSGAYLRKFGQWSNALKMFVSHVNEQEIEIADDCNIESNHKTKRDINLRMRFIVMQRDNFKCCMCGASPAKDPSVELHIDHIVPWSKGGETTLDNLQTLCSKCNLGKSNLM